LLRVKGWISEGFTSNTQTRYLGSLRQASAGTVAKSQHKFDPYVLWIQ